MKIHVKAHRQLYSRHLKIEFYTDRVSLKNMTDKEHLLYFYDKAYRFDYKAGVDTSGAKYWNFVNKTLL